MTDPKDPAELSAEELAETDDDLTERNRSREAVKASRSGETSASESRSLALLGGIAFSPDPAVNTRTLAEYEEAERVLRAHAKNLRRRYADAVVLARDNRVRSAKGEAGWTSSEVEPPHRLLAMLVQTERAIDRAGQRVLRAQQMYAHADEILAADRARSDSNSLEGMRRRIAELEAKAAQKSGSP